MTQTPALDTGKHYGDLVDQLLAQHKQVRAAIYGVAETTTAESRQEAFDRLREMLMQHETAEEKIVHPMTRAVGQGDTVADARVGEEDEGKELLAELEELDIASVEFARLFEKLAGAVLAHAEHEESQEFPLLRQYVDSGQLERAEALFLEVEATALA